MALRRPHRKSRQGCVECKRRRVKVFIELFDCCLYSFPCDEARPTCFNCATRHTECEYGSSTSLLWANEDRASRHVSHGSGSDTGQPGESIMSSVGTPDSSGILGQMRDEDQEAASPTPILNAADLELMIQWCNSTYENLSRNELTDPVWRYAVPKEALSHPFLMHGILALSSLHLARTGPEQARRASYLGRAVAHQNQALALFLGVLADINETNSKAIFAFVGIVVVYTFGFPHSPDVQDPWNYVDYFYQVLVLSRGMQQVVRSITDMIPGSAFAPLLHRVECHAPLTDEDKAVVTRLQEANHICGLRDAHHETDVFAATIDNFAEMLGLVRGGVTTSTIAGWWAIILPQRFLELLRKREPFALVILAHYSALLQYLKHQWCFDEWCVRVAKAVWAVLDDQCRPLVHWAMREILGQNYIDQV
ncbi:hypothetical protein N7474_006129 [Penicillium riverlandense]|uniref:uncharacterized protein n=1 Tax=Penicillium riverlandense TaxID=1903569 RepID=UPI0025466440|nr:uncharacterized protein N7474_006129 [Penicillium riverlandense]KAJ5820538.1 hypothetical protein N7474_006129 [Penicillium riverlandense]